MSQKYILDASGQPVRCDDLIVWAKTFEESKRRIAFDTVNGADVSTVFLGVDHQFSNGPPLLFETLVFGGPHDGHCERYATRAEAEAGHQVALALARRGSTGRRMKKITNLARVVDIFSTDSPENCRQYLDVAEQLLKNRSGRNTPALRGRKPKSAAPVASETAGS